MKFSCSQNELSHAINLVRQAVKDKTTMTVLEGILFNVVGNRLHLTATDLTIGITTSIPVDAQEDGGCVLNAQLIYNIASRISGDTVFFKSEPRNQIRIESGNSEFTMSSVPADEFPAFPQPDSNINFKIDSRTLKKLIDKTKFAVATNETHMPTITGIKFELEGEEIRLVAIDGFRLAIQNGNLSESSGESEVAIIPGAATNKLSTLLSQLSGEVNINLSPTQVFFTIGNTILTSRLIEGTFFDYNSIIPKDTSASFMVPREQFLNCCQRASLIEQDKQNLIKLEITGDELRVSSQNEISDFNDLIEIDNKGEELTIGFNTGYLIDALKSIDDEKVKMDFSNSVGPVHIHPLKNNQYSYLVLPVRLTH